MLERYLITAESTQDGGKNVSKPFDKIFFSSRFHLLGVLSQKIV